MHFACSARGSYVEESPCTFVAVLSLTITHIEEEDSEALAEDMATLRARSGGLADGTTVP